MIASCDYLIVFFFPGNFAARQRRIFGESAEFLEGDFVMSSLRYVCERMAYRVQGEVKVG